MFAFFVAKSRVKSRVLLFWVCFLLSFVVLVARFLGRFFDGIFWFCVVGFCFCVENVEIDIFYPNFCLVVFAFFMDRFCK